MRRVKLMLVLMLAACTPTAAALMKRGEAQLADGNARAARESFDRASRHDHATLEERQRALLQAARASDRGNDPDGARERLERLIEVDVPGVTELALFELAERIRGTDRARALNLYYRAAAAAQKNGGHFPYRAAMDRILQMSMQP